MTDPAMIAGDEIMRLSIMVETRSAPSDEGAPKIYFSAYREGDAITRGEGQNRRQAIEALLDQLPGYERRDLLPPVIDVAPEEQSSG